jgi:hypothetical protein
MKISRMMAAALAAGWLAGCQRGAPQPPAAATAPATQPATLPATAPASRPATRPAMAMLIIGGQDFWFPQAALRLRPVRHHLEARLSTNDPETAIERNYQGNSFDLNMPLAITKPGQLAKAVWHYMAPADVKQDESAHGIFLDGQSRRLHPQDVTVRFQPHGRRVTVDLSGWFLLYQSTAVEGSFTPPQRVFVHGELDAALAGK